MLDNISLIQKAHRCSRAQAEQIAGDLKAGRRTVKSNEALLKAAGAPQRANLTVLKTGEVRPIGRVTRDGRSRVAHPTRPGNSRNGQHGA